MLRASTGRKILYFVNAVTAGGGFAADWNRTHLFNPRWPPHAKFHDGLSISLGLCLGGLGLYSLQRNGGSEEENLRNAAIYPALFFGSQLAAFAYPNAEGLQAEFPDRVPRIGDFYVDESVFALTFLSLTALGYVLASRADCRS